MDGPRQRGLVIAGMVAAGAGEFAGFLSAEMPDLEMADLDSTQLLLHGLSYSLEEGPARERELEQERERERERALEQEQWLGGSSGVSRRPLLSGVEESAEEGEAEAEDEEEGEEEEEEEEGERQGSGEEWRRDGGGRDGDGLLYGGEEGSEYATESAAELELLNASYDDEYGDELGSLAGSHAASARQPALARDPSIIDPDYLDDEDEDFA
jgi:hypothetical protein